MTILRHPLHSAFRLQPAETTDAIRSLQSIYHSAQQLEQAGAFAAARSAWTTAAEADDTPRSKIEFAAFLIRTRCHAEATRIYEGLLTDERVITSDHLRSVVRHNLAAALRQSGEAARAASLQQMANRDRLLADGELTSIELTASSLDALANGDLTTAQELLQRTVLLERLQGDQSAEAADCSNLATIAIYRGEHDTAVRFLFRAWQLHRATSNWYSAAQNLLTLSDVLLDLNRPRLAIRCLDRARLLFHQAGAFTERDLTSDRASTLHRSIQISHCNPLLN
ncbi:hypothetical protein GC176_12420 [bacterium]|nr:hypothetical protein [bacterium]